MTGVTVADDVLTAQPNAYSESPGWFSGWFGSVSFLIAARTTVDEHQLAELGAAAASAAERFAHVTDLGVELPGSWVADDARLPLGTTGPAILGNGFVVGAKAEDEITPQQAETMVRIVLAELHSRRVSGHVSCPPAGVTVDGLPSWPISDEPQVERGDAAPERWFVGRTVRCVTTTGLPYWEREWLRPDGTWSRSWTDARTWSDTPASQAEVTASVIRLREDARQNVDPRMGAVNDVSGRPNPPPFPLPPDGIRDHGHVWTTPSADS